MINKPSKKEISKLIPIAAALAVLSVLVVLRIYKCPLDFVFGIPCPLCGITRAFLALLHGDISMAFYYHPLWPVILLAGILYILYLIGIIKASRAVHDAGGCILCVLLILCYVWRHLSGSPVVRIHPDTSLIFRIISLFSKLT